MQSINTAIFIPSSFDFIRVHNYFRQHAGVSFTVLSEYVPDKRNRAFTDLDKGIPLVQISHEPAKHSFPAKNHSCSSASVSNFTNGSFLLIFANACSNLISTIRYKIRGIRNIIFFGPPDHPQYFTELLSYPFLDDGVEVSDVTCRVLYSKYDWFRLERIAGTEAARGLIQAV